MNVIPLTQIKTKQSFLRQVRLFACRPGARIACRDLPFSPSSWKVLVIDEALEASHTCKRSFLGLGSCVLSSAAHGHLCMGHVSERSLYRCCFGHATGAAREDCFWCWEKAPKFH